MSWDSVRIKAGTAYLYRSTNLPPVTNYTMCGWVNLFAGNGTFSQFATFGTDAGDQMNQLGLDTTGLVMDFWTGADHTGSTLVARRWYHVAMAVSGSGANLSLAYLDGRLDVTTSSLATTATDLWIGGSHNAEFVNGRFSNWHVYNRALTVDELLAQMRSARPLFGASLNAWYPMKNAGTAGYDASGNGNHMTMNGILYSEQGGMPGIHTPPPVRKRWLHAAAVAGGPSEMCDDLGMSGCFGVQGAA